jgi:hypothetical protein
MFDKDKPYGTVYGVDVNYTYVQNGKFYNAAFQEVTESGEPIMVRNDTRRANRRSKDKA